MTAPSSPVPPVGPATTADARLFLALWPDEAVRSALLDEQARWTWPPGAGRVPAASLHLTLHFLGAVPRARLGELADGLAVPPLPPTPLALDRRAVWPNGVAVLEPTLLPPALPALHAALAAALLRLGLTPEARRWRPHVTLARRATGALRPPSDDPLGWTAEGYVLVESGAGRGGGYALLRRYPAR